MNVCVYYQAHVKRAEAWFLVAILRSFEHLAFDRTLSKEEQLFEFFVPPSGAAFFERLMQEMQAQGVIYTYKQLPHRLHISGEGL